MPPSKNNLLINYLNFFLFFLNFIAIVYCIAGNEQPAKINRTDITKANSLPSQSIPQSFFEENSSTVAYDRDPNSPKKAKITNSNKDGKQRLTMINTN